MSTDVQSVQTSELPSVTAARSNRNVALDLLRIVSALGVVWFHCKGPGKFLAYAGLPALIALSLGLATAPGASAPFSLMVVKRAKRLLLPWLFWCAVYGGANLIKSQGLKEISRHPANEWAFLAGTSLHLWYLPFAFLVTCLARPLLAYIYYSERTAGATAVMLVSGTTAICAWILETTTFPAPFGQWVFGFPAVAVGLSLPHSGGLSRKTLRVVSLVLAVSIGCLATHSPAFYIPCILGTAAIGAAWLVHIPALGCISWLAGLSFGIYLVHPFVQFLTCRLTPLHEGGLLAILVILISIAVTDGLKRTPLRHFM
ncbi:acyltransferase family protein [Schlesneria sp. DSM 10557]|uniref:acyltransferase family protein n=1 Tax=Schlesneria sp. DSM 10557 TaxID=3044399 RepID=UPI0035A0CDB7